MSFVRRLGIPLLALLLPLSSYAIGLGVSVNPPSPAPVGSTVRLYPNVENSDQGTVWYRFRVRPPGEANYRIARDFSPNLIWNWAPMEGEGDYEIEVTARSRDTGETDVQILSYSVASRVAGNSPNLARTENPLVLLYSSPACPAGSRISVRFVSAAGDGGVSPSAECNGARTTNLYLAGLRPETEYTVQQTIQDASGTPAAGPEMKLSTGPLPFNPPASRPLLPAQPSSQGVIFQNRLFDYSLATDLNGNVIWYIPETLQYITRPIAGGYFIALVEDHEADDSGQLFRVIDLAGHTVLETNAARINEQLAERGLSQITSFHHEARRLPDGRFLVLAGNERFLTDVQGPGEVAVLGDMILLLNANLEVEWVWDGFDHLDPSRRAILDEKCVPRAGGCPVMRIATEANDWLHGNSLAVTPDGGILYSARHQDWIIKIDFANGIGSGNVLWRLGKDGDFGIVSDDREPWFSHQHDASVVNGDSILLFDNGNTRYVQDPSVHSRGQVLKLDEGYRLARLTSNFDLGAYALALGSAQQLTDGHFHFNAGWLQPNMFSQALEFDSAGTLVNQLEAETAQYRSFRMKDLYTPE